MSSSPLGVYGENTAALWLIQHGYQVRERNFRTKHGEIDIVAWDSTSQELVFVEVKTRTSTYAGQPVEAVGRQKWLHWQRTAQLYLQRRQVTDSHRFDIISVWHDQIEHFDNISWYY